MRTGLIVPISNDALGIAFLLAIAFVVIAGIFKLIQKATYVERESIKFANNPSSNGGNFSEARFTRPSGDIDPSELILPNAQDASSFFTQLSPRANLNVEINRTKNTLIFSNFESTDHRLVIAITGSGRYAAAYYATGISAITTEPRLSLSIGGEVYPLKASAESLIFRDQGTSFYEISSPTLNALIDAQDDDCFVSAREIKLRIERIELQKMKAMAKLVICIEKQRSDIIFLGN